MDNKNVYSTFLENKDIIKEVKLAINADDNVSDDTIKKMLDLVTSVEKEITEEGIKNIVDSLSEDDLNEFAKVINVDIDDEQFKDVLGAVLFNIAALNELEKERVKVGDSIREFKEKTKISLQEYEENEKSYRKMMEESYIEKANATNDPNEKKKLLDTSFAYTDGYKLTKLYDYYKSDEFNRIFKKYKKRFNVLCSDFDYLVQRVTGSTKINITLGYMKKCMEKDDFFFKFEDGEIDKFCVALGLYARYKVDKNYKPDMWLLYCICSNVIHICSMHNPITEFDKEKIQYFIEFFNKDKDN